jgi:HD-GYP domain-containing protein (c-di-GMP phosphodiesterase class II)
MSSDPPSDAPSPAPDSDPAGTLRIRGEPLLEALASRSQPARDHSDSVAAYAFAAAVELGLDREVCELTREAARLHEIGQVYAVHQEELGSLQEEAARLARGAGVSGEICGWLLRTRERFDGAGLEGLAGEAIPIQSRLIRAACALQVALAESGPGDAAERLGSQAGTELDPHVVEALVAVVARAAA